MVMSVSRSQGGVDGRHQITPAGRVEVAAEGGYRYVITARGHKLFVDQPVPVGGQDSAATPTEMFVASIASCIAFYVGRYLRRHDLDAKGFAVWAEFAMAEDTPTRVGSISVGIKVPAGVPVARRKALLAVASHCTVHNTLRQPPAVTINLQGDDDHEAGDERTPGPR
jgi:putative redox protein